MEHCGCRIYYRSYVKCGHQRKFRPSTYCAVGRENRKVCRARASNTHMEPGWCPRPLCQERKREEDIRIARERYRDERGGIWECCQCRHHSNTALFCYGAGCSHDICHNCRPGRGSTVSSSSTDPLQRASPGAWRSGGGYSAPPSHAMRQAGRPSPSPPSSRSRGSPRPSQSLIRSPHPSQPSRPSVLSSQLLRPSHQSCPSQAPPLFRRLGSEKYHYQGPSASPTV
jgi:hypothetical protein